MVQEAAPLSSACLSAEASGSADTAKAGKSRSVAQLARPCASAQQLCAGRSPSGLSFRTLPVKRLLICRDLRSLLCSHVPKSL